MAHFGKRLKQIHQILDLKKIYSLEEAVKIVKSNATARFDETIEIAINLNVDPRKSDQNIRGVVQLPHGTGKTYKVAVFARGAKAQEAKDAGADIIGAEDLAEKIQAGEINFQRCIATPDMMGVVGRVGRILGPRGLMPNPKLNTVTLDVANVIKAIKGGQVEYRAEKTGIVHSGVGKASFSEDSLVDNIKVYVEAIQKAKPTGVKGGYMKSFSLGSTMGPSVRFFL